MNNLSFQKTVFIINKTQFGYHTDYYKYCEYLRDDYNIKFLCFDSGFQKFEMDGIKVKYVSNKGSKIFRGARFLLNAILQIVNFNGIVFIKYFDHCQFLKCVFPWKIMILDIRSLSVSPEFKKRVRYDLKLKKATSHFDFTTIISKGLREKLKLKKGKSAILPLGADIISTLNKDFTQDIKMLYVGTLEGRNIYQTICGLSHFLKNNPTVKDITYDIVGDGIGFQELEALIAKNNLEGKVRLHGRIPHFQLKSFFDSCTVGVSYVPMTEYYEHQPVTKTYEYILSGIPCIATDTYENRKIINRTNGVLCDDNMISFAHALEEITQRDKNYDSNKIRTTLEGCGWDEIVRNNLIPLLNNLYK